MAVETPSGPVEPLDTVKTEDVLRELNAAAIGLDQAADELRRILPRYEGYEDGEGTFHPGAKLRWEELVQTETLRIVERYEDKDQRPPAKDTLAARANAKAKEANLELWGEYHALAARILNLQKWISAKRETVSARQSVLKAAGIISGPNPQWSR